MEEKIKKVNVPYLLCYIFLPVIICAISGLVGYTFFKDGGNGAVICFMAIPMLAFLWWILAGSFIFKRSYKKFEKELDNSDFKRNQTFYGKGKTVFIDTEKGQIGIIFFWNPTKTYTVPASRVERAWVDDGKSGAGFMEGSGRVSFLFTIDGIKVRVDTFTSNQRFRMDSDYILTGISKADLMVKMIEEAKKKSLA